MNQSVLTKTWKLSSINSPQESGLCPNLDGQIMMELMVRGPEPGTESYEKHQKERSLIFESLKRRAKLVAEELDSIPGFHCQRHKVQCVVSLRWTSRRSSQSGREEGSDTRHLYALSILGHTRICVVPETGFQQNSDRNGFRTTFLPPEVEMQRALGLLQRRHEDFCSKHLGETVVSLRNT